ncbi:YggS family pyridoxal phosphate-dependent enzyme [Candidatus Margulisiibacteriota bacterium]
MPNIKENLLKLKERISSAAKRVDKDASAVKLIASTKDVPASLIRDAVASGVSEIGENRLQEAEAKYEELKDLAITWHMIGHLQTNKVKKAVNIFSVIQSVDSPRLADKISTEARKAGKNVDIFLEINTSGEASKYGIIPEKAAETAEHVSRLPNLSLKGLMTVGPLTADNSRVRDSFRLLKNLSEQIKGKDLSNVEIKYLSMGMTDDFEAAIEEGSNLIRVGRAIFGIPHKH